MGFNSDRKLFLIILLLTGALVFLFNLGGRDLWDPDETRYAVIAREMRESGNWVLPLLNGDVYAEKPPLFFWLVNLSTFIFGEDSELVNRLPSALAGLFTILLTFLFGERLFNTRTGFLSGLVLATCFFFPQISRWMMLDSLFTLFFLLTLYCFCLGYEKEEGRREYYLLAGLFVGLGVLTKGPIAYLTIPIFMIFSFLQKEVKKFWNRDLLMGFLLSLVIVFMWLIPACWLGREEYTKKIVFGQTIGRLAEGGKHFHPKSFFFYFIRFPVEFMPWTFFIPFAFSFGLKRGVEKRKEFLFLIVWFIFIFLFFTLSRGKKDNYILPLYPAAALMVGGLWESKLREKEWNKRFILGLLILPFLSLLALVLFLSGGPQKSYPALLPYQSMGFFILSYLLAGSFFSLLFFIKKKPWASFMSLAITFIFFHLHISYALPAKFNAQRSMKVFSEKILKRMEEGDKLKMCFFRNTGLLYYSKKPFIEEIRERGGFLDVLRSPERSFIVIQRGDLEIVEKDLKIKFQPIEEMRVGHWNLVLILNR